MAAPKPVRAMNPDRLKVFTGSANLRWLKKSADSWACPRKASVRQFADGEIYLQIQKMCEAPTCSWFSLPARGRPPLDGAAVMIDALKRSSAQRITAGSLLWIRPAGSEGQAACSDSAKLIAT